MPQASYNMLSPTIGQRVLVWLLVRAAASGYHKGWIHGSLWSTHSSARCLPCLAKAGEFDLQNAPMLVKNALKNADSPLVVSILIFQEDKPENGPFWWSEFVVTGGILGRPSPLAASWPLLVSVGVPRVAWNEWSPSWAIWDSMLWDSQCYKMEAVSSFKENWQDQGLHLRATITTGVSLSWAAMQTNSWEENRSRGPATRKKVMLKLAPIIDFLSKFSGFKWVSLASSSANEDLHQSRAFLTSWQSCKRIRQQESHSIHSIQNKFTSLHLWFAGTLWYLWFMVNGDGAERGLRPRRLRPSAASTGLRALQPESSDSLEKQALENANNSMVS